MVVTIIQVKIIRMIRTAATVTPTTTNHTLLTPAMINTTTHMHRNICMLIIFTLLTQILTQPITVMILTISIETIITRTTGIPTRTNILTPIQRPQLSLQPLHNLQNPILTVINITITITEMRICTAFTSTSSPTPSAP